MQSIHKNLTVLEIVKKNEQTYNKDAKLQCIILKKQKKVDIIQQRMKQETAHQITKQQKKMNKITRAAQQQIDKELRDEKKAQKDCLIKHAGNPTLLSLHLEAKHNMSVLFLVVRRRTPIAPRQKRRSRTSRSVRSTTPRHMLSVCDNFDLPSCLASRSRLTLGCEAPLLPGSILHFESTDFATRDGQTIPKRVFHFKISCLLHQRAFSLDRFSRAPYLNFGERCGRSRGRFVYDEEEQKKLRHVQYDLNVFAEIAAKAVGATQCVKVEKCPDGLFNKV
ncbi:hypothetical protein PAAG_00039 [Paracoccidioides lutzii Pb01]|uniref:Uncharacterized protein n=1 Tax=Paracoccidioides lutzii (strain ATCC MYA-826 / Pb01) TaxID=502779 RepID=C1GNE4_PARBA|nr:hypothetical protein PAAG_00039 [Paracoccidioides lutzii Pb01]EEH35716.2 hypothetical protein PAAG_00039 [Paracoccidioides lutzii Pb01]